MKLSKYTFIFIMTERECAKSEYYVYNTLSNALIEIDKQTYSLLKEVKRDADLSRETFDDELWDALCANNILTDNDWDDYLKYKAIIMRTRGQRTDMHLTIAPTMDCCFHCHYCFEKYKSPIYMSSEVMSRIMKYIASLSELNKIKITWFGGEPLMGASQIEELYDRLNATKKIIASDIITTGYHLNEETIRIMKKVGITSAQITLDGMKETHNKVKHLQSGEDVFERVLSNIELLNVLAPEINIVIRVNLTHENEHEYMQLYALYSDRFKNRSNMGIAPAFVLDRSASNCDICIEQNTLFKHAERSEFILKLAKDGVDSPFIRYPEPFFNECAIRDDLAIAFDPEGYAYKCWEVIGNKEYAIGRLNDAGVLTDINEKILNRQLYGADIFDDPICSQCRYLPICSGGCPLQRIQNKFENGHNSCCSHLKGYMVDFLKIHIARKKAQEAFESKES